MLVIVRMGHKGRLWGGIDRHENRLLQHLRGYITLSGESFANGLAFSVISFSSPLLKTSGMGELTTSAGSSFQGVSALRANGYFLTFCLQFCGYTLSG